MDASSTRCLIVLRRRIGGSPGSDHGSVELGDNLEIALPHVEAVIIDRDDAADDTRAG